MWCGMVLCCALPCKVGCTDAPLSRTQMRFFREEEAPPVPQGFLEKVSKVMSSSWSEFGWLTFYTTLPTPTVLCF